jgi:hypothetical protein
MSAPGFVNASLARAEQLLALAVADEHEAALLEAATMRLAALWRGLLAEVAASHGIDGARPSTAVALREECRRRQRDAMDLDHLVELEAESWAGDLLAAAERLQWPPVQKAVPAGLLASAGAARQPLDRDCVVAWYRACEELVARLREVSTEY